MTKRKKLSVKDFYKENKALKSQLKKFVDKIDKQRTKLASGLIIDHSPVKNNKVYDFIKGGTKRRGVTTRVYITVQRVTFFADQAMITAGGYWLNSNNECTKWDNFVVWGVGNPVEFILSKDQAQNHHQMIRVNSIVSLNPKMGYAGKQLEDKFKVIEVWDSVYVVRVDKDSCMTKPKNHFIT